MKQRVERICVTCQHYRPYHCEVDDHYIGYVDCPYYSGTANFSPCKLDNDALELLNDYERLAEIHVEMRDAVNALLTTLEEVRKESDV